MKQTVEEAARERCNYELIVEEYFGIKKDIERQAVMADFNSAVDLVCAAHQKWAASLPTNSMQWVSELLEDYRRKLATAQDAQQALPQTEDNVDTHKRIAIKIGCYRSFITELEKGFDESAPTEPRQ